jgi:hypothetical protein
MKLVPGSKGGGERGGDLLSSKFEQSRGKGRTVLFWTDALLHSIYTITIRRARGEAPCKTMQCPGNK